MKARKQDFFYIARDSYDDLAERSLPHYREGHALIGQIVAEACPQATRALDLGTGTGVTAEAILRSLPTAQVTCVDAFEEMLLKARQRLLGFGSRVDFVVRDNTEFLQDSTGTLDLIVSAFCLHHLTPTEKQLIFRLIQSRLDPGGVFLMLDFTRFENPVLEAMGRRATEFHMKTWIVNEPEREAWLDHWNNINIPDPCDQMIAWLQAAGLHAETVCRWLQVGLIVATR